MHDVEEDVVVRAHADQERAQHAIDTQVELVLRLAVQESLELGIALALRQAAQVDLAKEPQQLLGVRQRHRREDIPARDPCRGRRGGTLLEETPLEQRPLCVAETRQPSLDVLAFRRGHCRELPASSPSWSNRVNSSSERPSNSAIRPCVSKSGLSPISSTTCCDRVATVGKLKRA